VLLWPARQVLVKAEQLDLEDHGGRSYAGVAIRVAQRILAMAATIWRNHQISATVTRSLIAYDH
jgi:hypothetical protein